MTNKQKRTFCQYFEESLQKALTDIREGSTTILGASKNYGVPRTTIQDQIHGPRRMCVQTVLSSADETRLVKWCHDLAKCEFPLKSDDLLNTVQAIIKEDEANYTISKWSS